MKSPIPRLVGASIARPWITLGLGVLIGLIGALIATTRFAMTTDTAALISANVPWRQQERAMERAFPQLSDVMLVVIDGKTPELAEDAAAKLSSAITADKAHFRRVSRPDGGNFFGREGLLFEPRIVVQRTSANLIRAQPLLGPLAADPSLRGVADSVSTMIEGVRTKAIAIDQIEAPMRAIRMLTDRTLAGQPAFFSWQTLFAGNGPTPPTRRLILAQPVLDHGALLPGAAASTALQAKAAKLQIDPAHGVTVRLTGEVPLADEEFATLQDNIAAVGLVMLVAMLGTLWLATRSVRLVGAIMVTIVIGLIVTAASGLLAVGRFNLISVAFIPLFVGLGIDFGIQICVRFNAERSEGANPATAMARAAQALGASLLLAASAVCLGFCAFLPTAYVGIAELGVIAGIGMIVALALSVTLLPALVLLLRPGAPTRDMGFARLEPAERLLARHRAWVLVVFALSMIVSIAALPDVIFDFNPLHLRDPHARAMRTLTDLTRDADRTPNTIDVLVPDAVQAAMLSKRLIALPEVRQVVSLGSFVPDDQPAKLSAIQDASNLLDLTLNPFELAPAPSDPEMIAALRSAAARLRLAAAGDVTPVDHEAKALAGAFDRLSKASPAQRALVQARLVQPLGVMLDQIRAILQAQPVTRQSLPRAIVQDWVAHDGRVRLQVFPAGNAGDNATIHRFRDAVARVTPAISGLPVATEAAASTVAGAFVQAGIIAFAAVSLLLLSVLRNLREVVFTLAPVILSIFLTLGTCVAIGQPLNFANIIAFPLLFGVGVAFHIYFVMAWRGGATRLLSTSLARAILFSACATGTAFGSLWFSHHPGTASMGKILMISLIWTLICALIFEPALLGPPPEPASPKYPLPGRQAGPEAPVR